MASRDRPADTQVRPYGYNGEPRMCGMGRICGRDESRPYVVGAGVAAGVARPAMNHRAMERRRMNPAWGDIVGLDVSLVYGGEARFIGRC